MTPATPEPCTPLMPEYEAPPRLLKDALKRFLPAGYSPSERTVGRWISEGLIGHDGRRVRLRVAKLGRSYITTDADVAGFIAAVLRTPAGPDSAEADQIVTAGSAEPGWPRARVVRVIEADIRAEAALAGD